jgi:hypothetical protein
MDSGTTASESFPNVSVTSASFTTDFTKGNHTYDITVTALGNTELVLEAEPTTFHREIWNDIWLVGIPNWSFPTGTKLPKGADGYFRWSGTVAANATFRFSLTDTSGYGHIWNGSWFAPPDPYVDGGIAATLDNAENDMWRFNTNTSDGATSATENTWKITTGGYYRIIVKPAEKKLRIEKPTDINGATVTLTIEDKGSGLTITGGIPTTPPVINKTGSPPDNSVTFTVDNPNATYTDDWYVNGAKKTGTSVTYNAADYTIGYHAVLLIVTIPDGSPWSPPDNSLGFRVE